jgi:hypothetical protein
MDVLTNEQKAKVLIIDDSVYDRSRSKMVECWLGYTTALLAGASRDSGS